MTTELDRLIEGFDTPLALDLRFAGVPVRVLTNAGEIRDSLQGYFAPWVDVHASAGRGDAPAITVRLVQAEAPTTGGFVPVARGDGKAPKEAVRDVRGGRLVAGPEWDVSGCSLLGSLYEQGWGVAKDPKRAAALFEKSCSGGDATGCFFLGNMYHSGSSLPKDVARAAALFERACNPTQEDGCYSLAQVGEMYLSGSGVSKDVARAAVLLERACDGGTASACASLGEMYRSGTGVRKDGPPPRATN